MGPLPRLVAICQGGPLDGHRFSIALDQDGSPPPPLEVNEHRYTPDREGEFTVEHEQSVRAQALINQGEADETAKHPVFRGFELHVPGAAGEVRGHYFTSVWGYKPGGEQDG